MRSALLKALQLVLCRWEEFNAMQSALRNARGRTVGEAMHEAAIISPDTSIMSAANSIVRVFFVLCIGRRSCFQGKRRCRSCHKVVASKCCAGIICDVAVATALSMPT
jgi:hypothetical protein